MPNFSPLVTVADTILPEPSTYEGNTGTIVDSARNTEGRMIGAVIRDDVAKVSMTWKYLTVEQWSAINRLFRTSSGGSFINSVTFLTRRKAIMLHVICTLTIVKPVSGFVMQMEMCKDGKTVRLHL